MPVMDEFREEREQIKTKPFKERMEYYVDYYKWHAIAAVAGTAIVISLIYTFVTRKESVFAAEFINCVETNQTDYFVDGFEDILGIDKKKQEARVGTTMNIDLDKNDQTTADNVQRLLIYVAAGDLDVLAADMGTFEKYAYLDAFYDLRECLSEKQIAKYQDFFFYVDGAVVRRQKEQQESGIYNEKAEYPKPFLPDQMEDPIPVAIQLKGMSGPRSLYVFSGQTPMVGILKNTTHLEESVQFIDALDNFVPKGEVLIPGVTGYVP